jgi:Ca2+-binding EF-hand superfamily protein
LTHSKHLFYLQIITESVSVDEIGGLKELFKKSDTDNSGTITFDELKYGLKRLGSALSKDEIQMLMDAVSAPLTLNHSFSGKARLVQLHEQLHEQLHNFNSQTTNSLPNSLVSFSENSLS